MTSHDQTGQLGVAAPPPGRTKLALRVAVGGLVLLAVVWLARGAGHEILALEARITALGILGPVAFAAAVVILTSIFVPSTVLSAAAGALFGLSWGALAMISGSILAAFLNYMLAKWFLRDRIEKALEGNPKLLAIRRAVVREGLRLQLMVRLMPINAVVVNYALGAAGVPLRPYLLASIGMIPSLVVEVYFGHMAGYLVKTTANVSPHSTTHNVWTVLGFLVCAILMFRITLIAQRAVAAAEA